MNVNKYGVLAESTHKELFSKISSQVDYVNIMRLRDNMNIAYFGHSSVIYSIVYEEDEKKISIHSKENPDVTVTVDKTDNKYPIMAALAHIDLYWGKSSFSTFSRGYNRKNHYLSFLKREIRALTRRDCFNIFEILFNGDFLEKDYITALIYDNSTEQTQFRLDFNNNMLRCKDLSYEYEKLYDGEIPSLQDIVIALTELHDLSVRKNTVLV